MRRRLHGRAGTINSGATLPGSAKIRRHDRGRRRCVAGASPVLSPRTVVHGLTRYLAATVAKGDRLSVPPNSWSQRMTEATRTIVMTGATRGIGLEAAKNILQRSPETHLALVARQSSGAEVLPDLLSVSPHVSVIGADLANKASIGAAASEVVRSRVGPPASARGQHRRLQPKSGPGNRAGTRRRSSAPVRDEVGRPRVRTDAPRG